MKLALAIILSLSASLAQADTLLTYQSPGKPVREIAIAGGKVNMKMSGENADVLFDTRLRAMSIVNHAERRYIVMDEAGIQKMAEFANQMLKMMENLPPQVREQMKGRHRKFSPCPRNDSDRSKYPRQGSNLRPQV